MTVAFLTGCAGENDPLDKQGNNTVEAKTADTETVPQDISPITESIDFKVTEDVADESPFSSNEAVTDEIVDTVEVLADYPWVNVEKVRTLSDGHLGIIVIESQCSNAEDFMVVAKGQIRASDLEEQPLLSVSEVLGVTRNYGGSGDPMDPISVHVSVTDSDYWCPDRREYCYKSLADGAFGLPLIIGKSIPPTNGKIYSLSDVPIEAFSVAMTDSCPRSQK